MKEENPDKKDEKLLNGLAKKLFAPSTFNVNAPVFKPTLPISSATPAEAKPDAKKRGNKKKKVESDKTQKPANN